MFVGSSAWGRLVTTSFWNLFPAGLGIAGPGTDFGVVETWSDVRRLMSSRDCLSAEAMSSTGQGIVDGGLYPELADVTGIPWLGIGFDCKRIAETVLFDGCL